MAVYQIVKVGDDVLREKAKPVPNIDDRIVRLLDNMKDTMAAANGVGLAAPQIGISKRVIIVDIGDGLVELINPEIIFTEGVITDLEACLSVPGYKGQVQRNERIIVKGLNRQGETIEVEAIGLFSRALQHEIDHLDGTLFIDLASDLETIE